MAYAMPPYPSWLYHLQNWLMLLAACIGLPSTVLYLAELATIVRHKQFRNSFYALFAIRAIAELLLYEFDSYFGSRLPALFGSLLLPVYEALPQFVMALHFFCYSANFQAANLASIFIVLNRVSAIARPFQHKQIWGKCLPLVVLVVFGVPLAMFYHLFALQPFILSFYTEQNDTITVIYGGEVTDKEYLAQLAGLLNINAVSSVCYLVVCLVLNMAAVYYYTNRQTSGSNAQQQERARIRRKLLLYGSATCLGHMLICLMMIAFAALNSSLDALNALNANYPLIMDFGTVVLSSWTLLWASDKLRVQMGKDLLPSCLQHNPTTTSHTAVQVMANGSWKYS